MPTFASSRSARPCDRLARREFLRVGAIGLGGLSLPDLLRARQSARAGVVPRARSVVILYLSGGPSQLDMWDMKPDAPQEVRGTFRPIDTRVPGMQVCEHMPRMARIADKYSIVRTMSHDEAEHLRAGYWVMTGSPMARPVILSPGMLREDRPHIGGILSRYLDAPASVPPFVTIPEFVSPTGIPRPGQNAGFLGARYDPYLINSDPNLPDYSPGDFGSAGGTTTIRTRLTSRRSLLRVVDSQLRHLERAPAGRDLGSYYSRAFDMVLSPAAQRAFDVSAESDSTRDRYGRNDFGQSTLVARRLVEAGVRLVQVNFARHNMGKGGQGYDSHSVPPYPPHLEWARTALLPPTDAAFSSLVEDLDDRGLLDETLVIMMGEFGRTPRFNSTGGRDHWPRCYSAVLAGGGIRRGHIHGASDRLAATPLYDPVSPEDLCATLYHLLGLEPATEMRDMQDRPFPISTGSPVMKLLS